MRVGNDTSHDGQGDFSARIEPCPSCIPLSKKAKSGQTEVDLIPLIARSTVEERRDTIGLDLVIRAQNPGLNPELVVSAIRSECPDMAPDFVSFHRRAVLDGDFQPWE